MSKKELKVDNRAEKKENFSLGWRRFISEIKNRKKGSIMLVIFSLFIFIPFASEKFLIGKVLDSVVNFNSIKILNFEIESAYFFVGMLVFTGIIWRVFDMLAYQYLGPKISNEVYKEYTKKVFSTIISYPTKFFKENSIGKITYSINTGAKTLSGSYLGILDLFGFPFLIVTNTFFLFFISWQVGIVVSVSAIVYAIFFQLTLKKRQKVTKDFNNEKKEITSLLTENVNLSIEIKKNSSEKKENIILSERMNGSFDEKFGNTLKFNIFTTAFSKFLFLGTVVINLFLLIWLYKNGAISEGGFLAAILYESAVMRNIGFIIKNMNKYVEDFTIIGDTEKLLRHSPENYTQDKTKGEVKGEIEYKNINFHYGDKVKDSNLENSEGKKIFSLSDINIKIKKGQKVAFVGESGGGKSTSVELVGGFYFPNSGEVLVDGIKTTKWNLHDLRSSIAYVSQDIAIFNSTIGENIAYGAVDDISEGKTIRAAKMAHIHDFIEGLPDGYKTSVGEKGLKLSGGQKQRIAIARAVLRDPKILILDEPTSALDIASEKHITESLKELMKGRTTIIIAHRLSTVADADKIFVFKEGKIAEEGNFKDLISQNGEFKKMVDLHEQLS